MSNSARMLVHVDPAHLGEIADTGVVDQHVDAAHPVDARLHRALVVLGARHVGADAVRPALGRHAVDAPLVAAGEDDLVPLPASERDERGADALAGAGDEKSLLVHVTSAP